MVQLVLSSDLGERGRETDRHTIQREREGDKQTQTDRNREKGREMGTQKQREMERDFL